MLKSLLDTEKQKQAKYESELKERFEKSAADINALYEVLVEQADGLVQFSKTNMEFSLDKAHNSEFPNIRVDRPLLLIKGSVDNMNVSGLQIFPLMGRQVTIEEFFKTIAPYIAQ